MKFEQEKQGFTTAQQEQGANLVTSRRDVLAAVASFGTLGGALGLLYYRQHIPELIALFDRKSDERSNQENREQQENNSLADKAGAHVQQILDTYWSPSFTHEFIGDSAKGAGFLERVFKDQAIVRDIATVQRITDNTSGKVPFDREVRLEIAVSNSLPERILPAYGFQVKEQPLNGGPLKGTVSYITRDTHEADVQNSDKPFLFHFNPDVDLKVNFETIKNGGASTFFYLPSDIEWPDKVTDIDVLKGTSKQSPGLQWLFAKEGSVGLVQIPV